MATAVIMPRQGQSVESCLIGKWHKNKGDKVSIGDLLFTYETDKAAFEEASKVEGILLDVFFEEGDDVECLVNVCVIGSEGESAEEFRPSSVQISSSLQADHHVALPLATGSAIQTSSETLTQEVRRVSPRARQLAERTRADLNYAVPTGANGRIMERDVQAVLSQGHRVGVGDSGSGMDVAGSGGVAGGGAGAADLKGYEDAQIVGLSNIRKFIAKAMHKSLAESAQLTHHSSFDATALMDYRKKLKAMPGADNKTGITVTDIIIYAVSRVLLDHKSINAHFLGDGLALFNNAHIGVAVDAPRGLLVPTIFNANTMSLPELSAHAKVLFEKCKNGVIEPDLLKGASFTISNLGGLGVEMFTPILNPPQTGLLGVCAIIERTRGGKPYPAMGLSFTYDHRALDGADAARFIMDLVENLESFGG